MPVRLLLDENLSERLLVMLAESFPDSAHVREIGLAGASDVALWRVATERDLTLVTRDADFVALSVVRGAPPKVIWLNTGNAGTVQTASLLISSAAVIAEFVADSESAFLALSFNAGLA